MSFLIQYISRTNKPYWLVLTWRPKWWCLKKVDKRIVFEFYIESNNKPYRVDYDPFEDDIIFVHPRPRALLKDNGVDPDDDEVWLKELQSIKVYLFRMYKTELSELLENTPKNPKWYRLIF